MPLDWLLWNGCLVPLLAPGRLVVYMAVLSFAKQAKQEIKEDGNRLLGGHAGRAAARRELEAKCPRRHAQVNDAQCAHRIQHSALIGVPLHTESFPPLLRQHRSKKVYSSAAPCGLSYELFISKSKGPPADQKSKQNFHAKSCLN